MPQSIAQTLQASSNIDDTIAGERPIFYWRSTWIPLVGIFAGEVILYYVYPSAIATRILEVVGFVFIGWWVMRRGKTAAIVAYAGAHVGIVVGISFALFELIADAQLWRIFNLIARPMWMGMLGFIISGLFVRIVMRVTASRGNSLNSKGGEHHG